MRRFAIVLGFCASATALAAPAPAAVVACPYEAGELAVTLGMSFKAGVAKTTPIKGGVQATCAYAQADGYMTLHVKQTVLSAAEQQLGAAAFERALTSPLKFIAGDPDRAAWQLDPYSPNNVTLHYLRGTHRVEIRAQGGVKPATALQPKLLRLRRIP